MIAKILRHYKPNAFFAHVAHFVIINDTEREKGHKPENAVVNFGDVFY